MRIAMIGHKRIPGREGGIEVVVEELSTRMASLENEVTVYNRKSRFVEPKKKYKNVHLITIPTIEKKSTDAVLCLARIWHFYTLERHGIPFGS